jgi:tetratricopeptide (TPR) repeat protein
MTRSFLSFTLSLATATLVLFVAGTSPAVAQPMPPGTPSARPSAVPKPKQYPAELQPVVDALRKHDYARAFKKLDGLGMGKLQPLPSAHVLMYQILSDPQINQPIAARAQLEEAVRSTPDDLEPNIILGNIALQEGRIAEATMDFEKARQLLAVYRDAERKGAMDKQVMSGIAQVAEAREDWKEAETRFGELLKLAPKDLLAHQGLAHALFRQGKTTEAYDILKKAKEIDRENAKKDGTREVLPTPEANIARFANEPKSEIWTHDGTLPLQAGPALYEEGENPEIWYGGHGTVPNDLGACMEIALWALKKGKLDLAKEQADAALKIEATDPKKYNGIVVGRELRGLIALWEKDWVKAEDYFQRVVREAPNDFVARNNLALALVEQDDPAKKRRALDYAEANYQNNKGPAALSTLGWVYFRRGEFNQAERTFDEAVKVGGGQLDNPDTVTYLAHLLYHQDRKYDTKAFLEEILKADRAFAMRPEARKLYEKVKDAKRPERGN